MKFSLIGRISAHFLENSCPSEAEKTLCLETAVITSNEFKSQTLICYYKNFNKKLQ